MAELVLDIDFGDDGNSQAYQLDGWGEPEGVFRWSIGRQSRLRLPALDPGFDHALMFRALPWRHPPEITQQILMLGWDERLLGTVTLSFDAAVAFDLPRASSPPPDAHVLTIGHLDSARSEAIDTYADGQSMGLMMRTLRVLRRRAGPPPAPAYLPPVEGRMEDGTLERAIEALTGCDAAEVLAQFENLGGWCGFGALQERFGVNHVGLLRYAGLDPADLAEGLFQQFQGIGRPDHLTAFHPPGHPHIWDVHETKYRIWWHTERLTAQFTGADIEAFEQARLPFLQRRLVKAMASARKMFVWPVAVQDAEVLAIFLALDLRGPNTLLYVTQSGDDPPGSVRRMAPGLLRARVDWTEKDDRGTDPVWLSVLTNAVLLSRPPAADGEPDYRPV